MTEPSPRFRRDYDGAMADLRARLVRSGELDEPSLALRARQGGPEQRAALHARMQLMVDLLWDRFGGDAEGEPDRGVSWVGFYLPVFDGAGNVTEMTLGPRRDRPACSPIGLHGACGRAFLEGRALVVSDVAKLGEGYVACDPRDQSELVVPVFGEGGECWGVLDFDSFEVGAFSQGEVEGVVKLLRAAGLTGHPHQDALVV